MKKLYSSVLTIFSLVTCSAQIHYMDVCHNCNYVYQQFQFYQGADSSFYYLNFDTIHQPNLWQIGTLSKPVFSSGFASNPRALVTDSVHPYASNNLSSFTFGIVNCPAGTSCPGANYGGPILQLIHRFDTDSAMDGGTIEVSHDAGLSWNNIITDTIDAPSLTSGTCYSLTDTVMSLGKPGFSGSSGWDYLSFFYQANTASMANDTILFRFTFSSDATQTNKDGWEIGELTLYGFFEGMKEIPANNLFTVFPSPAKEQLFVLPNQHQQLKGTWNVLDLSGHVIKSAILLENNWLSVKNFPAGFYFLQYEDEKIRSTVRFVKSN